MNFNSNISDTNIELSLTKENFNFPVAVCSCSLISGKLWYFNRLSVHSQFRRNKYGSMLLDKLLSIIKEKDYVLQLDINPYGEMTYEQLEEFYISHGFEKIIEFNKIFGECERYYYNAIKNKKENKDETVN